MEHAEDFACDGGSQDRQYYESYEDLSVHRVMLSDRPRMAFYKRLLTDPAVVGDKVVVDVGSGTGVLSAWAATAGGARHVFSIEASSMADLQPVLLAENDVAEKVTVLCSTVEALVVAGPQAFIDEHRAALGVAGVAVLLSEWMGFYLFHEGMLPSVLAARDFFTEVNALLGVQTALELIPSSARLLAAPMRLEPLYRATFDSFWGCVDGVRMSSLGRVAYDLTVNSASPLVEVVPAACLLVAVGDVGGVAELWSRELSSVSCEELQSLEAAAHFSLTLPADCSDRPLGEVAVDGFTLWFEVAYRGVVLDTSPAAPPTHWKQTTILLPQEAREERLVSLAAVQGSTLDVLFTLRTSEAGSRCYTLEFELC